jgi:hypothetical protein
LSAEAPPQVTPEGCYLSHRRQEQSYGCLYHAAYAVTGDERLLAHVENINVARYRAHLAECGYTEVMFFNNVWLSQADEMIWRRLARTTRSSHPFVLEIDSPNFPGFRHMVAVQYPGREDAPHFVSDSTKDGIVVFANRAEFLASPYAKTYLIAYVQTTDLGDHPFESAAEALREEGHDG